jgi:hypothetical protein
MDVEVYSVLANSVSSVCGSRLSVLEAIVVLTPSSQRSIEAPLTLYSTKLGAVAP